MAGYARYFKNAALELQASANPGRLGAGCLVPENDIVRSFLL